MSHEGMEVQPASDAGLVQPRIIVRTIDRSAGSSRTVQTPAVIAAPGVEVSCGRDAEVPLGRDPLDAGVSRIAVVVTAAEDGWRLRCLNRNGISIHPWAQAPAWLSFEASRTLFWPRIGLRIIGTLRDVEHWVLLENDAFAEPLGMTSAQGNDDTFVVVRPRRLTASQLAAAYGVFAAYLSWPPLSTPSPRSLESVGQRLGITPSAIRERLRPLQERAQELGLHQQFGVTEPDYIFHLATHGYFEDLPPSAQQ